MIDKKIHQKLKKIFYNPNHIASYGSIKNLYKATNKTIPLKIIKKWLSSQDTYTAHKPIKHKFFKRKVLARGIDYQIQADLIDMQDIKKYNKNFKYILTAINIFSRKAVAIPLKFKNSIEMIRGMKIVMKKLKPFKKIQTDQGTEFFNKKVQSYLKESKIIHFFTASDLKSSIVERFNRTLKEKIYKHFTATTSLNYLNVLPKLVNSYNNKIHRSIGTSPNKVNKNNEKKIWNFQYKHYLNKKQQKFKFKINDNVKLVKYKGILGKGYLPKWTNETFIITDRLNTNPPTYKIRDSDDNFIKGSFYEPELQQVIIEKNKSYPIKILKTRKKNNKIEYFVHFVGFPNSKNTWIQKNQITK